MQKKNLLKVLDPLKTFKVTSPSDVYFINKMHSQYVQQQNLDLFESFKSPQG